MEKEHKRHLKRLYIKTLAITLGIGFMLLGLGYGAFVSMLGGLNRSEIDEEKLSVSEQPADHRIINIALYGVDSRNYDFVGRSDAIMIASINSRTGKIKLISVARDTYVPVPGYGKTKINHAYSYGGPELAIRTLNENFDLNITDYITVNFDSLAEVIDEMGGVMIDVTEQERKQVNAYLLEGAPLQETGYICLNGPQAVSYARIRKIDSDSMRAARQREVLSALFETAKGISSVNYPSYVKKFLPMVETSLSNDEILRIAAVGLKGSELVLEQAAFPNEYLQTQSEIIGGVWYYVYDLGQAADMLRQYIQLDIPFERYGVVEEIEVIEEKVP